MAKILSISSEVLSGAVGNTIARPVLVAMGHEVMALPTVILAAHPGHGATAPVVTAPEDMDKLLSGLERLGRMKALSGIITGYFATAPQVGLTANWIRKLKTADPDLLYFCDPIIGDGNALYVKEDIAEAIRGELLPLADVLLPNRFELEWLTGRSLSTEEDIRAAANSLPAPTVVCSSALASETTLTSLLIEGGEVLEAATKRLAQVPHGTGDLLTALFTGKLLLKQSHRDAFHAAVTETFEICEKSEGSADLTL